jgi:epoxyqueuosine reductase
MDSLETRLKYRAHELGFALVGIAPATAADGFVHLQTWLANGFAGEMGYMQRHAEARRHPSSILPEVRTVVMLAMTYVAPPAEAPLPPHAGKVARYARSEDYHDVLRRQLKALLAWLQQELPNGRGRAVVDTAPLLERDFARRAGLGWIGKNTMLIHPGLGSYFLLGALLLDHALVADSPFVTNHCGTCTACLRACPTDAFPAAGQLDARRCISYLTIELRDSIPDELRTPMGEWVFGCDVCQEVCPWNRKAPAEGALPTRTDLEALDLIELLGMSEADFHTRFHGTALSRPRRAGLLRNAAIVLGNRGDRAALPALRRVAEHQEPLIREAAQWAIAQIESRRQ